MEYFQLKQREQAYEAIYPSQRIKTTIVQEAYNPNVAMESVRSHRSRSDIFDPEDVVATTETLQNGTGIPQRIRVSAMMELKEFNGKYRDEDKARTWISKVKSAFLCDQAPDEEKCLVFGDLLIGPARNWYNQLS